MKKAIGVILLVLALTFSAHAQSNCNLNTTPVCTDDQTITRSGQTIPIKSNAGLVPAFEYVINGSPSTISIVIQGCGKLGTCQTLDTYTTVANTLRNPTVTLPYDHYTVTATWTDGTNVSVQVATRITTAVNGSGGSGTAATVSVGTVTTGTPGSSAAVNNSGSSANAILNFTIPRGSVGAAGADGATGATGPQGPTGTSGTAGPVGLIWLGAWNNTTAYVATDGVSDLGASYIAIAPSTGIEPYTDTAGTYWQLLAQKGSGGGGGGSGTPLVPTPSIYGSDNGYTGYTAIARLHGASFATLPASGGWKIALSNVTGSITASKVVILRTLAMSQTVIDSTTVTFATNGTTITPGLLYSDAIPLAVDRAHDYVVMVLLESGAGDSEGRCSGGYETWPQGGDQTGAATVSVVPPVGGNICTLYGAYVY